MMKKILISVLIFSFFVSLKLPADFTLEDPAAPETALLTLVLAGGTIYNGDGGSGFVADVGISEDRIVKIGDLSDRKADLRIGVSGLAVTPGFIEIHNHAEGDPPEAGDIFLQPDAENYIGRGVTTVIIGSDGYSEYPVSILLAGLEEAPAAANVGTLDGRNTVRGLTTGQEQGALNFSQAIHESTGLPADRIGLHDRGRIEVGAFADIVVLDRDKLIDHTMLKNPHQMAESIQYVYVSGQAVLYDGMITGARPGRVLGEKKRRKSWFKGLFSAEK